ncbi:hypothetical protein WA1_23260 [Scytonema hofmannii PCC 7110]|uniref:Tyr recombinase domain-containing protein n=1 Tax=Scytonema hofmannii PCC 7110 TaxID=128403 RepID=A0A139X8K6_9CYAN|nr:hypothetical protein WA1_23260 [Scytonema hofmannii PCC 7110]
MILSEELKNIILDSSERGKSDIYVFTSPKGFRIDNRNFWKQVWKPLLKKLNIEHRKPYYTRATMISHSLKAGVSPLKLGMNIENALISFGYDEKKYADSYQASQNLSALRAVSLNSENRLIYATTSDVIGILETSVSIDNSISPLKFGFLEDNSFNWEPQKAIYLERRYRNHKNPVTSSLSIRDIKLSNREKPGFLPSF